MLKIIVFCLIAGFALAALAFIVIGREKTWEMLAGPADTGPIDLQNLSRSSTSNDGLICTPGACPQGVKADDNLPVYGQSPEALINTLKDRFEVTLKNSNQPYKRVDDGADPTRIRYITWSKTMRFPDTTEFIAIKLDDGRTGLIGYARAQIGQSDFGSNLARLKALTENLDQ